MPRAESVWFRKAAVNLEPKHTVKHLRREHGERETAKTTQHCISCNSRRCKHQVRIDDVVHQLEENRVDAETEEQASECRNDPRDAVFVTRPTEPEEPDGERHASDHWPEETPFRNRDVVVGFQFLDVARVRQHDGYEADHDANDHSNVG